MADLITTAQFEARTGRTLTASQTTQVEALISDASALVIDIVNDSDVTDLWTTITPATIPGAIVPVVVSMVRRGVDNPNGYVQSSIDDFSFSYGRSGSSGIFATRDEVRAIRKAVSSSGVNSLNLDSHLPVRGHVVWLDGAL